MLAALEPDEYYGHGRGRVLQFYATDEELRSAILASAPPEFGPYSLAGSRLVENGGDAAYVEDPFEGRLQDLPQLLSAEIRAWLRSHCLTPEPKFRRGDPVEDVCAMNGLIGLQHDHLSPGKRGPTRMFLNHRVQHCDTGEVIYHEGYDRVFASIKRRVKRLLVWTAVLTFPSGESFESKTAVMSDAMAQLHLAGELELKETPGRKIRD
jgi:hypothetical protein